jgi:hypothetical protein
MSTHDLDRAWAAVNAIGGHCDSSEWHRGANWALDRALLAIEELGGKDPLLRKRQGRKAAILTLQPAAMPMSNWLKGIDVGETPDEAA